MSSCITTNSTPIWCKNPLTAPVGQDDVVTTGNLLLSVPLVVLTSFLLVLGHRGLNVITCEWQKHFPFANIASQIIHEVTKQHSFKND